MHTHTWTHFFIIREENQVSVFPSCFIHKNISIDVILKIVFILRKEKQIPMIHQYKQPDTQIHTHVYIFIAKQEQEKQVFVLH